MKNSKVTKIGSRSFRSASKEQYIRSKPETKISTPVKVSISGVKVIAVLGVVCLWTYAVFKFM